MNNTIQDYLPLEKIEKLKTQWASAFQLLRTRLEEEEELCKTYTKDAAIILNLYEKLQGKPLHPNDLSDEEVSSLQSAFQNFLFFSINNIKSYETSLLYKFTHQIEGLVYNALIASITLYPANTLDEQGKLISLISKMPLDSCNIALSSRQYESIPMCTQVRSDTARCNYFAYDLIDASLDALYSSEVYQYSIVEYALGNILPQDYLRIFWLLENTGIPPLQNKQEGAPFSYCQINPKNYTYSIFLTNDETVPLHRLTIYPKKKIFTKSIVQYFSTKYLSFYVQLVDANYSFYTITALSDFLVSDTPEAFKKDKVIQLNILTTVNSLYSISKHSLSLSLKQLCEIYAIAVETGYPLDASNAHRIASFYQKTSVKLINWMDEIIWFSEHPVSSIHSEKPALSEETNWITKGNIKIQQKEDKARLDTNIERIEKLLSTQSSELLTFLKQKAAFANSNYGYLHNALRLKIRTINNIDTSEIGSSLQGVIYNTLITLGVCYPQNLLETPSKNTFNLSSTEHNDTLDQKLLDPVEKKPIPHNKKIMLAEGCYFNKDSFVKLLDENTEKKESTSNPLKLRIHKLGENLALPYQTVSFDTGGLEIYFAWRDIVRLIYQLEKHPTIPIALYPHIKPIEEDDIPEQPNVFIMPAATKQKWQTEIKNTSHLLSYDHLSTYVDLIEKSCSLQAILLSKDTQTPSTKDTLVVQPTDKQPAQSTITSTTLNNSSNEPNKAAPAPSCSQPDKLKPHFTTVSQLENLDTASNSDEEETNLIPLINDMSEEKEENDSTDDESLSISSQQTEDTRLMSENTQTPSTKDTLVVQPTDKQPAQSNKPFNPSDTKVEPPPSRKQSTEEEQPNNKEHEMRLAHLLNDNQIAKLLEQHKWHTLSRLVSQVGQERLGQALDNIETLYGLADKKGKLSDSQLKQSGRFIRALADEISYEGILRIDPKQCKQLVSENQRFQTWVKELKNLQKEKAELSSRKSVLEKLNRKYHLKTTVDLLKVYPKATCDISENCLIKLSAATKVLSSQSTCNTILQASSWKLEVQHQISLLQPEPLSSSQANASTTQHHTPKKPLKISHSHETSYSKNLLSVFFKNSSDTNKNKQEASKGSEHHEKCKKHHSSGKK